MNPTNPTLDGLTPHDLFAAAALAGLLARGHLDPEEATAVAFELADEMARARAAKGGAP